MGPIILLVEFAHKMTRKLAVNFSIVRLRADWASRESKSASLMMTTESNHQHISQGANCRVYVMGVSPLNLFFAFKSTC